MNKVLLIAAIMIAAVAADGFRDYRAEFQSWQKKHAKFYAADEVLNRFESKSHTQPSPSSSSHVHCVCAAIFFRSFFFFAPSTFPLCGCVFFFLAFCFLIFLPAIE
jgi:hypothetical protein